MKRCLIFSLSWFAFFSTIPISTWAAEGGFRVTLLGTASPQVRPTRLGPSTLVEAGEQTCCSMLVGAFPPEWVSLKYR